MLHASNTSAATHPRRGIRLGINGSGIVLVMSATDWETRELESASRERLLVEIGILRGSDINALKKQVLELQHELLSTKDFTIGAAAEVGEARAKLIDFEEQLQAARARSAYLSKHINRMRNSTTWKLGRFMMLPVRTIKKVIRRAA